MMIQRNQHSQQSCCRRVKKILFAPAFVYVLYLTSVLMVWRATLPTEIITNDDEVVVKLEQQSIDKVVQQHKTLVGMIPVFYNVFTIDAEQEERVQLIVDEQLSYIDPEVHTLNITSIGHRLSNISNASIREHYTQGSEELTLHALWEYCKRNNNNNTKVVYLHAKGSYHDNRANARLRPFLTKGALSKECSNLPDTCNVCSTRMSPLPHPHTPGNMWLARCDYVAKLVDPNTNVHNGYHGAGTPSCKGFGRYFMEHWIHSHPSVMPCDLYPGKEFVWGYWHVPEGNFTMDLQMAPRFELSAYEKPECISDGVKIGTNVDHRMWSYEKLYNITSLDELDDSWWGWKVLNGKNMNSSIVME